MGQYTQKCYNSFIRSFGASAAIVLIFIGLLYAMQVESEVHIALAKLSDIVSVSE